MLPVPYNRNLTNGMFSRFPSFMNDMEDHWNKLVDSFFNPASVGDLKNKIKNGGYPKLDTFETADQYIIQASVPGVDPDDLNVEMYEEGDTRYVAISGQMAEEYRYKDEDAKWCRKELRRSSFRRVESLPEYVQGDPEAKIKDGIVTLSWPTVKQVKGSADVKKITLKKG